MSCQQLVRSETMEYTSRVNVDFVLGGFSMPRTFLVATLLVVFLTCGVADAQTVVSPADIKEIVTYGAGPFLSYDTWIRNPTGTTEVRLFFEFDLSKFSSASVAVFYFSAIGWSGSTGTFYLQPMTSGMDGSVTTGDFSLLGSPIWTGTLTSSAQTFVVPVTSWFNSGIGGYAGFALTAANGVQGNRTGGGTILTDATEVPEPGTLALFGLGLASLFVGQRIRRRRKSR